LRKFTIFKEQRNELEDNLTFLDAVNHFLAKLITECLYFFFIPECVDMTILGYVKIKAVSKNIHKIDHECRIRLN